MSKGKVFLVGAGCGSYDLITLRGKALLESAEVVIYDSLIDDELLGFVPDSAVKIHAGKRAGRHSASQEDINALLIHYATLGKTVVRLKGGDPFVFGRGGEELSALEEHGIAYGVVPGITSAVAVPELAGIPVTHRGASRSVHIITAHTREDTLPEAIGAYARMDGTLVFLMGLSKLSSVAAVLMNNGKSGRTPAAVISRGASSREKVVRGTLAEIARLTAAANITAPAVIVVGETAAMRLKSRQSSVTVVGTPKFTEKLRAKLACIGCEVQRLNLLQVVPSENRLDFENVLCHLSEYTAAVFTSSNGVDIFFERLKELEFDIRRLAHLEFAVVGDGTAEALKSHGIIADKMPPVYSARALAGMLADEAGCDTKLLILRAAQGTRQLDRILEERCIPYSDIKIYDVKPKDDVSGYEINTDILVFSSPSGVNAFYSTGHTVSRDTDIVAIGETTADALKQHHISRVLLPEESTADGIVGLIEKELLCKDSED